MILPFWHSLSRARKYERESLEKHDRDMGGGKFPT